MENDLISKTAAIEIIFDMRGLCRNDVLCDAMSKVNAIPAVDAAPVVRCKDCKYAHLTYDGDCKYCDFWQEDGGEALYLDGDFYCAAGERRDGGDADESKPSLKQMEETPWP